MKLNAEQQKAVNCNDKKILCLACAGAGKTQVLISRLWRLVSQDKVDPQSILCLTFTRAAAFEMRERYAKLQKQHADEVAGVASFKPEINTFHAFCYSLILHDSKVRSKIGYTKIPKILDPKFVKKYQNQAIIQASIKLPLKKLTRNAERTKSEEMIYKLYDKSFRRLLRQDSLITFDILCDDICKLFYTSDNVIAPYLNKYQHILVDEFQDTDSTQVQFMESFKNASWFCVGDALQNLYSFRGTSNEFIKQYSQDESWTKIRMNRNYRSTEQICNYANQHSQYADSNYRIQLVTDKVGPEVTELKTNEYNYTELEAASQTLQVLLRAIQENRETAILCRTNAEVEYITKQLAAHNIDCTSSKKDFTAENILRSCLSDEYMVDWLSTFLPSDTYANYIRLKTIEENPDARWFVRTFGNTFWIKQYLTKIIEIRKLMMTTTQESQSIYNLLEQITRILDLSVYIDPECTYANGRAAIEEFIESINEAKISEVYCGTVHSVKGLEFQDVVIVGVHGSHFKLKTEENKNIFYVAITRAKEHLTVIAA